MPTSFDTPDSAPVVGVTSGFHYTVLIRDQLLNRTGTSVRVVPNASIKLVRNGTTIPAVIYSDDNFTVANNTGIVTTDSNGVWTAYLDPTYGPYQVVYKNQAYPAIPVPADSRESEFDLQAFLASFGLDQIGVGETIATRQWVNANVATSLTANQVQTLITQALQSTLSTAQVQSIVDAAIAQANVGTGADVDVTPFARIRGDLGNRDIVIADILPTTPTYQAVPQITADGKIYFQKASLAQAPSVPVTTPEAVDTITTLSSTHNHFAKAYVLTTGKLNQSTVNIRTLSRAFEECAVQGDRTTFDLIFTWAQANLKRTASSSANNLYATTYTGSAIVDATVDSGAMLTIGASLIRAWNLWNDNTYKDAASLIGSDLVNYCTVYDEGRAYLAADETNKAVANGHHTSPGGGAESFHEPGSINPMHLRAYKTFTGAAVFDQLLNGWYDLVNKMVGQNTSGLVADFCSYNTASHAISSITNGVNGYTFTKSNNFGPSAQRVGQNVLMDKRLFQSNLGSTALSKLVTFYVAKWAADGKIYDTYTRTGTAVGTNQTTEAALISSLILKDAGSTSTASAIRSAKVPTTLSSDANGFYLPNQVTGTTASTSIDGDVVVWLAFSRDQDRYVDIAKLGSTPNVGKLYPPGTQNPNVGNPGTNVPVVIVDPNGTTAPTTGTRKLYADTQSLASLHYANNSSGWSAGKKARWQYAISRPSGFWVSHSWGDSGLDYMRQYLGRCKAAGADATILIYDMPGRDTSGGYSGGGQATAAAYKTWYSTLVIPVMNEFPDVKKWIVAEPDSAADMPHLQNTLGVDAANLRADLLKWMGLYATTNIVNLGGIYLDAGHPMWHPASEMASILLRCGIEGYTGFAVNTSNTWNFDLDVSWAQQIRAIIGTKYHFTIDCGRNGSPDGGTQQWANPPQRRFGRFPQAGALGVDGLDLICDWKRPGESDGNSGDGAPLAGDFWPTYLYNDSVGDNVDTSLVSTSSGMTQRPPVPAVTNPTSSSGQASQ